MPHHPCPGAVGGEGWRFDQPKIQMPHRLGKSGDQIPSYPFFLYLEVIRWGFDPTKGQIPHSAGTYFVQNQVYSPTLPHPLPQGG